MSPRDPPSRPILTWLSRIRMLLACGLCAYVASQLVWYSDKPDAWRMDHDAMKIAFMCFAPFTLLVWSLLPAWGNPGRSYRLARLLILLYAGLGLIVVLAAEDLRWNVAAGLGAVTGLALMGLGPWRTSAAENLRFYRWSLLLSNGAVISGLLILSFANIGFVTRGAARIAVEKPYCLQVLEPSGRYSEAHRLLDLRGLSRYGPDEEDGFHHTFYTALVVQNELGFKWYKWSYRHMRFLQISQDDVDRNFNGLREPVCQMRPHFVQALPFF